MGTLGALFRIAISAAEGAEDRRPQRILRVPRPEDSPFFAYGYSSRSQLLRQPMGRVCGAAPTPTYDSGAPFRSTFAHLNIVGVGGATPAGEARRGNAHTLRWATDSEAALLGQPPLLERASIHRLRPRAFQLRDRDGPPELSRHAHPPGHLSNRGAVAVPTSLRARRLAARSEVPYGAAQRPVRTVLGFRLGMAAKRA